MNITLVEAAILRGLMDEFATESFVNNYDLDDKNPTFETWASTSIDNARQDTGISINSIKGHLTNLKKKGFLDASFSMRVNFKDESVITFTSKVLDVLQYDGHYSWSIKQSVLKGGE
jgi:hypothetical protein